MERQFECRLVQAQAESKLAVDAKDKEISLLQACITQNHLDMQQEQQQVKLTVLDLTRQLAQHQLAERQRKEGDSESE